MYYKPPKTEKGAKPHEIAGTINVSGLIMNRLEFYPPKPKLRISFFANEAPGAVRFRQKDLPIAVQKDFEGLEYVYSAMNEADDKNGYELNLTSYPAVARAWYYRKLYNFLVKKADYAVSNFIQEPVFYVLRNDRPSPAYTVYDKFLLRIHPGKSGELPAITIIWQGVSRITVNSLSALLIDRAFDTRLLVKVAYQNKIYAYPFAPDEVNANKDKVKVVLNHALMQEFGIPIPESLTKNPLETQYHKMIEFYERFMSGSEFGQLFPNRGNWKMIAEKDVFYLPHPVPRMVFQAGHETNDVNTGLKRWGPWKLSSYRHVKAFFIYVEDDLEKAKQVYSVLAGKEGTKENTLLATLARLPMVFQRDLNIAIKDPLNPMPEVREALDALIVEPDTGYVAIYLSRYTKSEKNMARWNIYHLIKEATLQKGITTQVIELDKFLNNSGSRLAVPNLSLAIMTRLNAIPWVLNRQDSEELVIGFGAKRSERNKQTFTGSAFCFNTRGSFEGFKVFHSSDMMAFKQVIGEALRKFKKLHPGAKRMLIHYHKTMKKKEMQMIESCLTGLKLDIPLVVIGIYQRGAGYAVAFDTACRRKLPVNGSCIALGKGEYLLYVNTKYRSEQEVTKTPLPLHLRFQCNQEQGLEREEVMHMLQQIHDFCYLHWRSIAQPKVPVTVRYPSLLAEIFPWFSSERMPESGERCLWFL